LNVYFFGDGGFGKNVWYDNDVGKLIHLNFFPSVEKEVKGKSSVP
jgi:hypothetical protein